MPTLFGTHKVIVSRDEVAAFNARWPASKLRDSRHYWFEFDQDENLIDSDVPEHDDGNEALAMSEECRDWLFRDEIADWMADDTAKNRLIAACEALVTLIRKAREDENVDATTVAGNYICGDVWSEALEAADSAISDAKGV